MVLSNRWWHLLDHIPRVCIRADDWDWPFSFNNVCENLCIDPEALRLSLLNWKARKLAQSGAETPTPTESKVYRLHLRTKRSSGVR